MINRPLFPWILDKTVLVLLVALVHEARAADRVDFGRQVRPILSQYCFQCHGPDAKARQADLRLDVPAGLFSNPAAKIVVRGKPAESQLIQRIMTADSTERMPPRETKMKLTLEQKEILRQWIAQGADYQQHWSFVAPTRPVVPSAKTSIWPRTEIDSFVLAKLEKEGLQPQPEADRTTLIRRLTFDLTGLPPTLSEIDHFLADTSPDAETANTCPAPTTGTASSTNSSPPAPISTSQRSLSGNSSAKCPPA